MTVDTFKAELNHALKTYDRHVVCLEKTPDEARTSLTSLLEKAIKAYQSRGEGLRHGIALDRHLTIILSQTDGPRPLCAIYYNLFSPYHKKTAKKAEPAGE